MHSGRLTSLSRVLRVNSTNYLCGPHSSRLSHSRCFTLWQPQMLPFCPNWLPHMWGSLPFSSPPFQEAGLIPLTLPLFSLLSFILSNFLSIYVLIFHGQGLLPVCSRCSVRSSASEDVFLMHPWREMHSTSTNTLLSCQLFLCDLMTFFSVIFSSFLFIFFLLYIYIYCRLCVCVCVCVCGYCELYVNTYI